MKDVIFLKRSNKRKFYEMNAYKINGFICLITLFGPFISMAFIKNGSNVPIYVTIEYILLFILNNIFVYLSLKIKYGEDDNKLDLVYIKNTILLPVLGAYSALNMMGIFCLVLTDFNTIIFLLIFILSIVYLIIVMKCMNINNNSVVFIKSDNNFYCIKLLSYKILTNGVTFYAPYGSFSKNDNKSKIKLESKRTISKEEQGNETEVALGYIKILNDINNLLKNNKYIIKNKFTIVDINNNKYGYIYLKNIKIEKKNKYYMWLSYNDINNKKQKLKIRNSYDSLENEINNINVKN